MGFNFKVNAGAHQLDINCLPKRDNSMAGAWNMVETWSSLSRVRWGGGRV